MLLIVNFVILVRKAAAAKSHASSTVTSDSSAAATGKSSESVSSSGLPVIVSSASIPADQKFTGANVSSAFSAATGNVYIYF